MVALELLMPNKTHVFAILYLGIWTEKYGHEGVNEQQQCHVTHLEQ